MHSRLVALLALLGLMGMWAAVGNASAQAPLSTDAGEYHPAVQVPLRDDRSALPSRWAQGSGRICCGVDDRRPVLSTTSFPYRSIVYLELFDALGFRLGTCSGALVGPNVVLTAAHCVYDQDTGTWTGAMRVVPGKNGSYEPFSYQIATGFLAPTGWTVGAALYDWGLVVLPSSTMGSLVGTMTIGVLSDATLRAADFTPVIAGYPGDLSTNGVLPYYDARSSFVAVGSSLLLYDIDTAAGESGAPVWRARDGLVVGIHTTGATLANSGTRMTLAMLQSIASACSQRGCSVNAYVEPVPGTATPTPTVALQPTATVRPIATPRSTTTPTSLQSRVLVPHAVR